MKLNITRLLSNQDADYVQFLDGLAPTSPSLLAYHEPFYRDMLASIGLGEPHYFGLMNGREPIAVLPGFVRTTDVGSAYCSLPFFGANGGVLCAEPSAVFVESLLRGALEQLRQEYPDLLSVSIYTPFLQRDLSPYDHVLRDAAVVEKYTQCHEIQVPAWDSSVNRNVRKAERNGLVLSRQITPERTREFYDIYRQNCSDHGIPLKPFAAVDYLMRMAATGDSVRCYFGLQEGRLVAGLMVLARGQTVSYYIPCTAAEARTYHPGTFLIEHALREFRAEGFRYWNWESSPSRDSGVYAYKKKWGAKEYPYRIYSLAVAGEEKLLEIGRERLAAAFPFYFVYPFDRLSAPAIETSVAC